MKSDIDAISGLMTKDTCSPPSITVYLPQPNPEESSGEFSGELSGESSAEYSEESKRESSRDYSEDSDIPSCWGEFKYRDSLGFGGHEMYETWSHGTADYAGTWDDCAIECLKNQPRCKGFAWNKEYDGTFGMNNMLTNVGG